ncbi:hypothetical protein R3P38DRAFT_2772286 [Favolaschia claudopus]|uniref:Uncharacterized protein n=1 Tax=Favolaschia claudopus TaxID=2862362 RepID=A0AAW0C6W7_9AGAR
MKTGYNTGNFKTHVQQRCKGPTRTGKVAGAGGHPTLAGMFKKLAKEDSVASQTSKPAPSTNRQLAIASSSKSRPCMGLSSAEEPLIAQYLSRAGADGGGGRSVTKITEGYLVPEIVRQQKRACRFPADSRMAVDQ